MLEGVELTDELAEFANGCVRQGRYRSIDDVVHAGLLLLRMAEQQRADFNRMLDEVRAETAQAGTVSAADMMAELDAILAEK